MRVAYRPLLVLLVGIALAVMAIRVLHAQIKPPVYVVIDVSEVTDPAGYKAVGGRSTQAAAEPLKDFGGRYLARTENLSALDGAKPNRVVIIAFDSAEKARGWYNSPAQKEVNAIRMKTTKSRAFIVEGM